MTMLSSQFSVLSFPQKKGSPKGKPPVVSSVWKRLNWRLPPPATHLIKSLGYAIVIPTSRRGGMVDTIDSKSIAGDCVRVQVSSPVSGKTIRKDSFLFFTSSAVLQHVVTPPQAWLETPRLTCRLHKLRNRHHTIHCHCIKIYLHTPTVL